MDKKFKQQLKKVINNTKDKDVEKLKKSIAQLSEYIKKVQQNFDGDKEKTKEHVRKEFSEQLMSYIKIAQTVLLQKEEDILNVFQNNPHILKKYYDLVKNEDLEKFDKLQETKALYGNEETQELFEMKIVLQEVRANTRHLTPEVIQKVKERYNRKKSDINKEDYKYAIIFDKESEQEIVADYVKFRKNEVNNICKENEIKRLAEVGKFLKRYDLLQNMLQKQNEDYEILEMPELKYEMNSAETGDIGLENIFEENYISKLNDEQLTILNAFWQNRFTKEVQNISRALFTIETLDLWDNIFDRKKIEVSDEQLKNILYKMKICNYAYDDIKDMPVKVHEDEENVKYTVLNLGYIDAKFKESYQNYFGEKLPQCENEFDEDFYLDQVNRNLIEVIYRNKNYRIYELLSNIEINRQITNWGYISDGYSNKNSLELKLRQILIGIDYPGFNNPIMLHINRKELIEYFSKVKGNTIIPIFEDNNYSMYKGRSRGRRILMPLTEKRESAIIGMNKTTNATDSRYQYITHLGNLLTKKVKKIQKIYPSKFVDLKTGKEGHKIGREFVPDNPLQTQEELQKNH